MKRVIVNTGEAEWSRKDKIWASIQQFKPRPYFKINLPAIVIAMIALATIGMIGGFSQ